METYISDNFPLSRLECPYFDICKAFDSDKCKYGMPCTTYVTLRCTDDSQLALPVRKTLDWILENYIKTDNLKWQIALIAGGK